ncbi:MAG TPA: radical SAM protein [Bryobacteraceae bacterium]|nr:radical SAM protein [Bryobacteraceae bacterium]
MEDLINLTGIARLAAEGTLLTEKRRVEYRTLPTRKWLNRCESNRVPFDWSLNPYRGCEFGCKYCYARFTHQFMERHSLDAFETEIYAKQWDSRAFRKELISVKPGQIIGIGTATDPYQPADRTYGLTRLALDEMRYLRGVSLFITTKSNLVERDIDVLKTLAVRNHVHVTMTVTTMDRQLARLTEPYAPRPDLRMNAVAKLSAAGVSVGVIANPVLPLITDSEENLEAVARAAKQAGAEQFGAHVLFLMPCARRVFFPFLADRFPQLLKRYEASFAGGAYLHGKYPERIRGMVDSIRARVGISSRDLARMPLFQRQDVSDQMSLFC